MTHLRPKHCTQHNTISVWLKSPQILYHSPCWQFHWLTLKDDFLKWMCRVREEMVLTLSVAAAHGALFET